jgi:hypothetical protein
MPVDLTVDVDGDPPGRAEPIAASSGLGSLAEAIQRRLYGPRLEALLGIRQLTPARCEAPPHGEPCERCGAIRDEHGKVLWVRTVRPGVIDLDGQSFRSVRPTGIQEGDALACVTCQCLSPEDERGRGRHGKPPAESGPAGKRTARRLTVRQRKGLWRTPEGRAWLLRLDAQADGLPDLASKLLDLEHKRSKGNVSAGDFPGRLDALLARAARRKPAVAFWLAVQDVRAAGHTERAASLLTAFYRHRDGLIGDEELAGLLTADPAA